MPYYTGYGHYDPDDESYEERQHRLSVTFIGKDGLTDAQREERKRADEEYWEDLRREEDAKNRKDNVEDNFLSLNTEEEKQYQKRQNEAILSIFKLLSSCETKAYKEFLKTLNKEKISFNEQLSIYSFIDAIDIESSKYIYKNIKRINYTLSLYIDKRSLYQYEDIYFSSYQVLHFYQDNKKLLNDFRE